MGQQQRKDIDLEGVKSRMDGSYNLISVDWRDNLKEHTSIIRECVEKRSAEPLNGFFDDYFQDSESETVDGIVEQLKSALERDGCDSGGIEEFFTEHEDDIRFEIYDRADNDDIEDMLRNTRDIPVRVEMYSNFDCINSHRFESQGGFSYESSYFGDMIDALRLNPKKVKQLLVSNGEKVHGRFPDRKYRDGRELVSYEQFYEEMINSSCGGNLLTFVATLNPTQLYEAGFNLSSKLTIPKGNRCGLFSSTYGGGSILEMELLRDVTLDLERTKYPNYGLKFEAGGGGYSIRAVYGYDSDSYGEPIRIDAIRRNDKIAA